MENHAILRSIHRDFGEQDARIACKTCAIIAGSWFLPLRRDLIVNVERVAHFARKSFEILDENPAHDFGDSVKTGGSWERQICKRN